jgi:hypothetical protein
MGGKLGGPVTGEAASASGLLRLRLGAAVLLLVALLLSGGELDSLVLGCRLLGAGGALLLALWLLTTLPGGRPRWLAIASFSLVLVLSAALLSLLLEGSAAWALVGALPVAIALSAQVWVRTLVRRAAPPPQLLARFPLARRLSEHSRPALGLLAAGGAALVVARALGAEAEEENALLLSLLIVAVGLSTAVSIAALSLAGLLVALPLRVLLGEAASSTEGGALARAGGIQALPGLLASLLSSACVIAADSPAGLRPRQPPRPGVQPTPWRSGERSSSERPRGEPSLPRRRLPL